MRWIQISLVAAVSGSTLFAGEQWPQFRGPRGDGQAEAPGLPLRWSETENVRWKTAIPGVGWSSPVIEGDQIWMQTALDDGRSLRGICVDRQTGKIIHDIEIFHIDSPEPKHAFNSHASPTPAIENGRVYFSYGMYGVACFDGASGKMLWQNHELKHDHDHNGPGSSPILYQNLFILNCDGTELRFVAALNKADGKLVWKTDRSNAINKAGEFKKAYSTPQIISVNGRDQLISVGAYRVSAYEPETGKEIWWVDIPGFSNVPRPVYANGLVYICTGFSPGQLWAVRPTGAGNVTATHVAWRYTKQVALKPSILAVDDKLYMLADSGVATCLNGRTGEMIWAERIKGEYSASPIHGANRIYGFNQDGVTTVLSPDPKFAVLATNQLDAGFMASPAVAGNALYLRTKTSLYRIESAVPEK